MKSKLFRAFSALMAVVLVFSIMFSISSSAAKSKSELEAEIAEIQEKRQKQEAELNKIKNEKNKQAEVIAGLQQQIKNCQAEIDVFDKKIEETNGKITELDKQIAKTNKDIINNNNEIEDVKAQLAVRMKATYMAGSGSTLKLLLSADNLATYLTISEMIKRIADHDDKIVTSLIEKIDKAEKLKVQLDEKKGNLEIEKGNLTKEKETQEAAQKSFGQQMDAMVAVMDSLDQQSAEYRNAIAWLDQQEEAAADLVQNMIAGSGGSGTIIKPGSSSSSKPNGGSSSSKPNGGSSSSGGSISGSTQNYQPSKNPTGYINPVPYSDAYISSAYGMRVNPVSGIYKMHAGIDISCGGSGGRTGPFTKKIVAAKAGVVSYSGWCSGYGNTVMITHDDGFLTLYGHHYVNTVSVGQRVEQGEQIAIMGTTGNSTGAHSHFEIRDGMWGNTMDPAPYI